VRRERERSERRGVSVTFPGTSSGEGRLGFPTGWWLGSGLGRRGILLWEGYALSPGQRLLAPLEVIQQAIAVQMTADHLVQQLLFPRHRELVNISLHLFNVKGRR
jgi:hypothetical protein